MSTLLIALGAALGKAVYDVGKEIAKPLTGPATEQFKAWARRRYDAKADEAKMSKAVDAAAQATGLVDWENWADYPLRAALDRLAGHGHDALRQQTIAAALAMTRGAPDEIPDELLKALNVDDRHRPDLARFLWAFREALARADEDYGALVELAHQDDVRDHLRTIASPVVSASRGSAFQVIAVSPEAREIESSYLDTLVETELRYLPLEGRRTQSPQGGLKMHLENVYIALNTSERAAGMTQERGELAAIAGERERQEPRSALYKALDCRQLLLLGEPGSGKTTFAEHLALVLAGERRQPGAGWAKNLVSHDAAWEGPAPLPVRVRLREFAANDECLPQDRDEFGRAQHLLAYIEKYLKADRWSEHLARHVVNLFDQGGALLVLDGLDEVADPQRRRQVAEAIGDLAERRCPDLWILVTCRVAQYPLDASGCCTAEWALPGFDCVTLADLNPQQIEDFADRWFGEVYGSLHDQRIRLEKAQELKTAIRDRPDLQEIAPRPILLSQMALIHDNDKLPDSRVDLYVKCTELLLWDWERIRAERAGRRENADRFIRDLQVPGLRRSELEDTLDDTVLAVHASQGDAAGPADIPTSALVEQLAHLFCTDAGLKDRDAKEKAACFVSEFLGKRNGLIVPAGEYSFQTPHRTFQEFMAARALLRKKGFHRQVSDRARENYDLWREVVVLAVGLAGRSQSTWQAVDAIAHLCPREFPRSEAAFSGLILAGEALVEAGRLTVRKVKDGGPDVVQRVEGFLQRAMCNDDLRGKYKKSRVPTLTRYTAAETLDRLGWLPDDLDAFVRIDGPGGGFYVAKYPVTNHQFARFMNAGGYEEQGKRWWSDKGWEWRTGKLRYDWQRTDAPDRWDEPRFGKNRRGYPVVGVSWYEANAYCTWLTEKLQAASAEWQVWRDGKLEIRNSELETLIIRLPTEDEWVAAAGGDEGDRYPWGQDWHESRANTRESGIGGTSPVGMYPSGRSTAGVWDMGGNVWEWMDNWYGEERRYRALRGGSWGDDRDGARARDRHGYGPGDSISDSGFRVCSSPAGSGC